MENTRLARNSVGAVVETPPTTADATAAMLPPGQFTTAQAEMAKLPLPFRNLIRDPFVPDILATGAKTTQYPAAFLQKMADMSCSSFRVINPNPCFVRFRGATDGNDLVQSGQGRLMAPFGVEVFSTQNPTYLSVMPVARPGYPIPAQSDLAPLELNYGIGG